MPKIEVESLPVRIATGLLGGALTILAVIYLFHLKPILLEAYLYALVALSTSILFIHHRAKGGPSKSLPLYDIAISLMGLGAGIYFALNAFNIKTYGWDRSAPAIALIGGFMLALILLEGTRRSYGWVLFFLCAFFFVEPVFSGILPGPLQGLNFSITRTVSYQVFGYESLLGTVSDVCGKLLVGYLIFAGVMQASGGGKFFLDLALALVGRTRGAPAKVSAISSGFFGMFSGAVIPNVLTTGAFTIPAMKKIGYSPYYAAAVEACASTGGAIMPPVMGTAAFLMAGFLGISYWTVVLGAALPAIIYYVIVFVSCDCYAGKHGLTGLSKEELPSFWKSLKHGFPYFIALFVLLWFIALEKRESQAPFFSVIALLLSSLIRKETRVKLRELWEMFESAVKLIAEVFVLIFSLGFVIGALTLTGVLTTFASGLVTLVGPLTFLLPVAGAFTGYVLGMGVTTTGVYIILTIVIVPALTKVGFSAFAAHMFSLYVGTLSFIIPPVAVGAITAGKLAGVPDTFKVGLVSMRLGMGLFILPVIFIFEPALLLGQAPVWDTIRTFLVVIAGFILIVGAFERYIFRFRLKTVQSLFMGIAGAALLFTPLWLF